MERVYTYHLEMLEKAPRTIRAAKAMRVIRSFLENTWNLKTLF